ncbi:MAG: hypothetical protein JRJ85_11660 [Deltaproteobacteria bacterium]|nr:hypothetical protein [Deltaproteobacteria bacterium]
MTSGPGSVVEALGTGKRAALAMHLYATGQSFDGFIGKTSLGNSRTFSIHALFHEKPDWDFNRVVTFEDMETLFLEHRPKMILPRLEPEQRKEGFERIDLSLSEAEGITEAGRCFYCGVCTGCDRCFLYCPELCIAPPEEGLSTYRADSEFCKGCAVCAAVCTRGVMGMGDKE